MEIESNTLLQTVSMVALAVIAFVMGIKKLTKDWSSSETESNVMEMMHKELERMSKQNSLLSEELSKLQQEIITLNAQLRQLCVENDKLQTEVVALTTELNLFKKSTIVKELEAETYAAS